jgi:hypothetical protein
MIELVNPLVNYSGDVHLHFQPYPDSHADEHPSVKFNPIFHESTPKKNYILHTI